MKTIWNDLLEFETRDLLERSFQKRFNRKPSKQKVDQITSNFIQGREYFTSANDSSITVRPLLLYYGVMALSKGLILSLNMNLKEEALKPSHGLEINNWNSILESKEFDLLEISVGDGTFSELLKTTNNQNYLRANSNVINYKSILPIPSKGAVFKFKQLINYFPDLAKEYKSWTEENLTYAVLSSVKTVGQKAEIKLSGTFDDFIIESLFPINYCKNKVVEKPDKTTIIKFDFLEWSPNITQRWDGPFNIGDACIIPTNPDNIGLNMLGGMYMMSYIFGMMARYFPNTWISLRRVERGDKIYPFAQNILDFIQEKFPVQVLDFLNGPYAFENI